MRSDPDSKLRIQSTPVWTALVQHLLVMSETTASVGQTVCDSAHALGGDLPRTPPLVGKGGSLFFTLLRVTFSAIPTAGHPNS